MTTETIHKAAKVIQSADALVIAAGAGMGVDSGLPDFRGDEGFWKAYPLIAHLGLSFVEMASPKWFKNDPELAWAFYGHRLNLYRQTTPHAGFATLLKWAAGKPAGYFVFTSNVDGQFQKSGFSHEHIAECHGSILHFQCVDTCVRSIWEAGHENVNMDESVFRALKPLPRCPHCGQLSRPNVLMFGDFSWIPDRSHDQQKRFEQWLQNLRRKSARLAVVELGAGTAIPTVRHTSEQLVRQFNGTLIRINLREPDVPLNHYGLAFGALAGIQLLDEAMQA